jgi:hypothetical protein
MRPQRTEPEPGETVLLADGYETRVRQVMSSDSRLGIFEVRDDRGLHIYITAGEAPGLWVIMEDGE